jgi:lysophospholipase L1-like esterase
VANEQQVEFLDAYLDLGINGYTAEDYLEDGVHLTQAGRQLYADALAEKILKIEETKNN